MSAQVVCPPDPRRITGLILCGGAGRRLGGADKAWLALHGRPLLAHVLERLAPQVPAVAVSANRSLDRYRALGLPVWPDDCAGLPGPLAGWAAGLAACGTPWLLAVPCDAPRLPLDLAARLTAAWHTAAAAGHRPPLCVASAPDDSGHQRLQPVFALLHRSLLPALRTALDAQERAVGRFALRCGAAVAPFDDAGGFINLNTASDWPA